MAENGSRAATPLALEQYTGGPIRLTGHPCVGTPAEGTSVDRLVAAFSRAEDRIRDLLPGE